METNLELSKGKQEKGQKNGIKIIQKRKQEKEKIFTLKARPPVLNEKEVPKGEHKQHRKENLANTQENKQKKEERQRHTLKLANPKTQPGKKYEKPQKVQNKDERKQKSKLPAHLTVIAELPVGKRTREQKKQQKKKQERKQNKGQKMKGTAKDQMLSTRSDSLKDDRNNEIIKLNEHSKTKKNMQDVNMKSKKEFETEIEGSKRHKKKREIQLLKNIKVSNDGQIVSPEKLSKTKEKTKEKRKGLDEEKHLKNNGDSHGKIKDREQISMQAEKSNNLISVHSAAGPVTKLRTKSGTKRKLELDNVGRNLTIFNEASEDEIIEGRGTQGGGEIVRSKKPKKKKPTPFTASGFV